MGYEMKGGDDHDDRNAFFFHVITMKHSFMRNMEIATRRDGFFIYRSLYS